MIKIGLIAASTASLNPQHIQELSPKGVQILPLIYSSPQEIIPLYEKNHWFLDGILFGGIFSQCTVQNHCKPRIPYAYLKVGDSEFLSVLLSLAVEGYTNFNRIATDLYSSCQCFAESLGYNNVPIAIGQEVIDLNAFSHSYQGFTKLVQEDRVDIVITRFSALAKELGALGVRVIEVSNSDESSSRELEALVTTIRNKQVKNNLPAVGLVCNRDQAGSDAVSREGVGRQLVAALNNFNSQHSMCLMIHPIGIDCEVLTSNADLYHITNGYLNCKLAQYLKKHLDFEVRIGWGVGMTMDEAYNCAATALVSDAASKCSSILQNLTGTRTISLNQAQAVSVDNSTPHLKTIDGISKRNLYRLYELVTARGMYKLSAEDIAYYLDITPRSASRIANTLSKSGLATLSHKQQYKVKGRPAAIYVFDPDSFVR